MAYHHKYLADSSACFVHFLMAFIIQLEGMISPLIEFREILHARMIQRMTPYSELTGVHLDPPGNVKLCSGAMFIIFYSSREGLLRVLNG